VCVTALRDFERGAGLAKGCGAVSLDQRQPEEQCVSCENGDRVERRDRQQPAPAELWWATAQGGH
jgi:hypothetical protein